jgi:predicted glycosyltransferase
MVCGPEMNEDQRIAVHLAARSLPQVSIQDFSDDMMSLIAAADVVVAMGGYNTVCELLTLRKRALLVPRVKPGLEQLIRAECMARLGLVRMLHPDALTPATLWAGLRAELAALAAHQISPELSQLDGLAHVTATLLEAIGLQADTAPDDTPTAEAAWSPRRITQPAPLAY